MTLHLTEVKLCVLALQINTRPQLTFLHVAPLAGQGIGPQKRKGPLSGPANSYPYYTTPRHAAPSYTEQAARHAPVTWGWGHRFSSGEGSCLWQSGSGLRKVTEISPGTRARSPVWSQASSRLRDDPASEEAEEGWQNSARNHASNGPQQGKRVSGTWSGQSLSGELGACNHKCLLE